MFGYININRSELKVKDLDKYQSYYCGLCRQLHREHGRRGQLLLNFDMTFLAILMTSLYELPERSEKRRCMLHPVQRKDCRRSLATAYAADMNVLLYYQKFMDDWKDERKTARRVWAATLEKDYEYLCKRYPRQAASLEENVARLSEAERSGCTDIDRVAGYTGAFLAEMFVWKDDMWQGDLRQMGFYLGKFIYLMDAFEDKEKDQKNGSYNIFLLLEKEKGYTEKEAADVLSSMMVECAKAFERLPILENAEILRNILYSGVWTRYAVILEKRRRAEKKQQEEKAGRAAGPAPAEKPAGRRKGTDAPGARQNGWPRKKQGKWSKGQAARRTGNGRKVN